MDTNDNRVDKSILTDHNYIEVLDRTFVEVPDKTIKAPVSSSAMLNTEFMQASNNFWLKYEGGKYYAIYSEGVLSGTYNTRLPTFNAISETFVEALKNIIRLQCEKNDKTATEFALTIKMVESSLALLSERLEGNLDTMLEGELMMSYLHAVFNSFVNVNVKIKE